jgi:hypothetical protein
MSCVGPKRILVVVLVLSVLSAVGACLAQPPMPFWNALSGVLGSVRGADLMRDECIKRFPKYADPINFGYEYWRQKHAALIDRIYLVRLKKLREYGGTDADVRLRVRQYNEQLDLAVEEIRQEMFSSSSPQVEGRCKGLATYYALERMDLSKYHEKELALIFSYDK